MYKPKTYGTRTGATKNTLQRVSSPQPTEHYVASGSSDTEEVYGTRADLLARYESAVAAAQPHAIVTLSASGKQAALATSSAAPPVTADIGSLQFLYASMQARVLLFDLSALSLTPTSFVQLANAATEQTLNSYSWWTYGGTSRPTASTRLTYVLTAQFTGDVEIPLEAESARWLLLANCGSLTQNATLAEVAAASGEWSLPSYSTIGTPVLSAADAAGQWSANTPGVVVSSAFATQADVLLSSLLLPAPTAAGELLTGLTVPNYTGSGNMTAAALDASGNVLASAPAAAAAGEITVSPALSLAGASAIRLDLGSVLATIVTTGRATGLPAAGRAYAYTNYGLLTWAARQNVVYHTSAESAEPLYEGSITTQLYVPDPTFDFSELAPPTYQTANVTLNIDPPAYRYTTRRTSYYQCVATWYSTSANVNDNPPQPLPPNAEGWYLIGKTVNEAREYKTATMYYRHEATYQTRPRRAGR